MSMKSKLGMVAMAAVLMDGGFGMNKSPIEIKDIDVTPKEPPVPNGCKRYYYNKMGSCNKGQHEVYFDAMKHKTAYLKYEKWLSKFKPKG